MIIQSSTRKVNQGGIFLAFEWGTWYDEGENEVTGMKKKWLIVVVAAVILVAVTVTAWVMRGRKPDLTHYEQRVREFEEQTPNLIGKPIDVVFLGDSLTELYDLQTHYPQYVTVNRGICGDSTHGLLKRMELSAYCLKPKVAVVLIGVNNLSTMMDDYEQILMGLRDNLPETKVVLLSLTAMGGTWAERIPAAKAHNEEIRAMAQEYGFAYVDLFTAQTDPATGQIRPEYTTDGGHQTDAGYAVFTKEITPVLETLLGY